jgi:hypothetical protein
MSEVEMHAPFTHYRGTIGKLVYRKRKGKTIVALKPDADRPLTEGEVAHRQDFSRAAAWATTALKNDEMRQVYEQLGKKRDIPARAVAVSDHLVSPEIQPLDLSSYDGQAGNPIYFVATDNVGITGAQVTITNGNGTQFESGIPVEIAPEAGLWMYTAMTTLPEGTDAVIKVSVHDRPGNIAEVSEEKAL